MSRLLMVVNEDRFFLSHRKEIALRAQQEGYDVTLVAKNTGRRTEVEALGLKMIEFVQGENVGFAMSFTHLLQMAVERYPAVEYFAFCDQDDVWLPNKLRIAIDKLTSHEKELALYISTTKLVDQNLNFIGLDCNKYNYTFGESFFT